MAQQSRRSELLERENALQEQRRNERKTRKQQKANMHPSLEEQLNMTIQTQRFVSDAWTFEEHQAAWRALRDSKTLQLYVPRFRYLDTRQRAVALREFTLEMPFELIRRIQKELAPHWRFAAAADEAEQQPEAEQDEQESEHGYDLPEAQPEYDAEQVH